MLRFFVVLAFGSLVVSCTNSAEDKLEYALSDEITAFEEEPLRNFVLTKLMLNPEDIGSFEMKRAHLNADGAEDGIVVINLAPKAQRDMERSSNPARFHDAGYIGDYNFIFIWDGATQTIGTAFKLVGNGLVPVEVNLVNLLDPGYKTVTARYRVQNSVFQTYFKNVNGSLIPVFSYLIVDQMGTDKMQVYHHALEENPKQIEKDIVIYEGIWTGYDAQAVALNRNAYPLGQIEPFSKDVYRFFYDAQSGKYATNSPLPSTSED